MRRAMIFLILFVMMAGHALAGSTRTEATVLAVGKNPATGKTVLVLEFDPDDWRRFDRAYRPRPGRKLEFLLLGGPADVFKLFK